MNLHYVLGQAGSGKSTFIKNNFRKDNFIIYNVGEILRGMFSCMKSKQDSKNVWSFANPIVYSMFKHCCKVSRDNNIPLVSDGLPRNSKQLMTAHRYLADFSRKSPVEVEVHILHITREEQMKRIEERDGILDEYRLDRIEQSRRDLEGVIDAISPLLGGQSVKYTLKWYKQQNGIFILDRTS